MVPRVECRCSGGPRQMGLAQGAALRDKIRGTHQSMRNLEAFRMEQPWLLPYPLFLKLAERKSEQMLVPALRQENPAMLARLEGIAEGAGLPLRSLCLLNAMEAFIASMSDRTTVPLPGACSAVAVRGRPDPRRRADHREEFRLSPAGPTLLRAARKLSDDGWRSLDFAVAPQAGTVDGMNEKGLAITLNYAFVTDPGRPNPLVTMLIADALAACATVPRPSSTSPRSRIGARAC